MRLNETVGSLPFREGTRALGATLFDRSKKVKGTMLTVCRNRGMMRAGEICPTKQPHRPDGREQTARKDGIITMAGREYLIDELLL